MSILVVLLPARSRAGAAADGERDATPEYAYLLSADGLNVARQGRTTPALLPKADTVVAWVGPTDVSWHRITLPRAPASKLRAALVGMLEEQLLDDEQAVHLAVAPQPSAGQPTWVAAVHKRWLTHHLEQLEKAGAFVERVVPALWPDDPPTGHFFAASDAADGSSAQTWLAYSDANGVRCARMAGTWVRDQMTAWARQGARWSAAPAVAAQAERWLGVAVAVRADADHALQAVRSLWNLRQFDLAARARGSRFVRDNWKRVWSPAWRPARIGVLALVVLHVIGINLWALHQRSEIERRKQAMVTLLKAAHPQVGTIVDAPVQMRRATDSLRAAAGRVGDADLEAALAAATQAWPDGQAPIQALRFEQGKLTLVVSTWSADQVERFRARLRSAGWSVQATEGRLVLSRGGAAKSSI
ncbi:MAG TPA: type II secretion system protein GspL [Burkholderiaceae bacterium]|jgi:general secretion pathway protein L|nr:type II secretion system protein GspL [Burkholderiaceae bacterium]